MKKPYIIGILITTLILGGAFVILAPGQSGTMSQMAQNSGGAIMGNDNEAKLDEATATPEFTLKPQTQTDTSAHVTCLEIGHPRRVSQKFWQGNRRSCKKGTCHQAAFAICTGAS